MYTALGNTEVLTNSQEHLCTFKLFMHAISLVPRPRPAFCHTQFDFCLCAGRNEASMQPKQQIFDHNISKIVVRTRKNATFACTRAHKNG